MSIRSVLIIRCTALGDVVLATSVLEPLRRLYPDARIEWLTRRAYAPLLEHLTLLDRVHCLEDAVPLRDFDLVIDLQNKLRTRWIAQWAGRKRLHFRKRSFGAGVAALFRRDPPLQRAHATELFAEVLRPLGSVQRGRPQIAISVQAKEAAGKLLRNAPRPMVGLAPGARWATKRWRADRWAQLGNSLAHKGAKLVLVGGPGDVGQLEEVRLHLKGEAFLDLSSNPLDVLAGVLGKMDLLISGDSGPVHLASAQGTKVLALFGPTSPTRWGPPVPSRSVSLRLPCSPCSNHGTARCPLGHHRCLEDLGVDSVLKEASQLIWGQNGS